MCTYSLTVNGKLVQTQEDKSLLRFLRDDLHLHSVKDGCSEGACGACTILADGKPVRACVLKTSRAEGKQILTVEGLADREKEIYVYAFGSRLRMKSRRQSGRTCAAAPDTRRSLRRSSAPPGFCAARRKSRLLFPKERGRSEETSSGWT